MKKLILLIAAMFVGTGSSLAASAEDKVAMRSAFNFGNSFIFVENGITFSVYPDGEFDFFIDQYAGVNAGLAVGPVGVTFNSGFNYNPWVQYDDYGAVIQVENVPIFYDFYGRVRRIGDIGIRYRNGLAYRIGGMRVFYNAGGIYSYHTGFINVYNRGYVFQPFHRFFIRPAVGFCLVYPQPYRRYYHPVRYTYYGPYYNNYRRSYARIGRTHRYHARDSRSRIYRNDRRVSARRGDFRYDRRAVDRSTVNRRTASLTEKGRNRSAYRTNRAIASRDSRSVTARSEGRNRNTALRGTQNVRQNRSVPGERARSTRNVKTSRSANRAGVSRSQARTVKNTTAVKSSRKATASRSQTRSVKSSKSIRPSRKSTASRSQVRPSAEKKVGRSTRKATAKRSGTARKSSSAKRSSSKGRSTRSGRH